MKAIMLRTFPSKSLTFQVQTTQKKTSMNKAAIGPADRHSLTGALFLPHIGN